MSPLRLSALPLLAALALSACAEAPREPAPVAPASRLEGAGRGTVSVLRLEEHDLLGDWEGRYTAYTPLANDNFGAPAGWTGPIAGTSALRIDSVEGPIIRGRITWSPAEGDPVPAQNWTSAISFRGDARFLGSVIFLKEQDGVLFLESDLYLPNGKNYLHRWVKAD